jgi:hypothetical protein
MCFNLLNLQIFSSAGEYIGRGINQELAQITPQHQTSHASYFLLKSNVPGSILEANVLLAYFLWNLLIDPMEFKFCIKLNISMDPLPVLSGPVKTGVWLLLTRNKLTSISLITYRLDNCLPRNPWIWYVFVRVPHCHFTHSSGYTRKVLVKWKIAIAAYCFAEAFQGVESCDRGPHVVLCKRIHHHKVTQTPSRGPKSVWTRDCASGCSEVNEMMTNF